MKDDLGDRMKEYEGQWAYKAMKGLPVMVRLDGRCFSKFTIGMARPYDKRLSDLMIATTTYLVKETVANIGYTQSDEISLTYHGDEIFFDGKIQKLVSVISSLCTAYFNRNYFFHFEKESHDLATFDCRVWQVPSLMEGSNVFLWRELDASKNSVSMACRHYYDHKDMVDKSSREMHDMLFLKGINWNDYPVFFKRGTWIRRKTILREFHETEISNLPSNHDARQNPKMKFQRTIIEPLEMGRFGIVANRVGVIYRGENPSYEPAQR